MKSSLRKLLAAVAVIAIIFAGLRFAARSIRPSVGYGIRAEFSAMPADDSALEKWLGDQPGVIKAAVNRDSNAIRVYWIMSQDLTGHPPTPNLRTQFERFGYKDIKAFDDNWVDG